MACFNGAEKHTRMCKGDWEITSFYWKGDDCVELKYATGFFMGTGEINSVTKKEKKIPCYKRWYITKYEGSRWLCNSQRLDCTTVIPGTRLYEVFDLTPLAVIGLIEDGTIDDWEHGAGRPKPKTRGERIPVGTLWSLEYDGMPIWCILQQKPKMSYADVVRIIQGEGGTVDASGLIHKAHR